MALITAHARGETRRALLIGINDYTASRLAERTAPVVRDLWPNLTGTVNDVAAWREVLVRLYGFKEGDIATLTDQQATRAGMLTALSELAAKTKKGDTVFFYYAGHGSQVANSRSDEPDKLDESIVPADSPVGARDIRDKELRPLFNRILDRGARLTILLDACHSGSGARGMPGGGRARGVTADLRDVADGRDYGPRPEDRGALVLSASQDFDLAWETRDDRGKPRGVFTWAWFSALRDAASGEAAEETFLRAKARVYADRPYQEPVIAGTDSARRAPFLGARADRRGGKPVVAVAAVRHDGTVLLQGGWANGLVAGSKLRGPANTRLTVKEITGLTRSKARIDTGRVKPGVLLEHDAWSMPGGRPLRVSIPRSSHEIDVKALKAAALERGIRWIDDPTASSITHLLRWSGAQWELVTMTGTVTAAGQDPTMLLPEGAALFVQLPIDASITAEGVEIVDGNHADYILTGRYKSNRVEYAWIRPFATHRDTRKTGLPARTAWTTGRAELQDHLARLRKIHGWHSMQSPAGSAYPYRLQLPRRVTGGRTYNLTLKAAAPLQRVPARYIYLFAVDSHGASTLLFPLGGSVENRFPADPPPAEIPLGACVIEPPYGIDTWFLLTTEEPLPNPHILEWDGVRAARAVLKASWSLDRLVIESVPPGRP